MKMKAWLILAVVAILCAGCQSMSHSSRETPPDVNRSSLPSGEATAFGGT